MHYIHKSAREYLKNEQQEALNKAEYLLQQKLPTSFWNLCKINQNLNQVSLLLYEDFEEVLFPCLQHAYIIDIQKKQIKEIDYKKRENPPVLHRQELMLSPTNKRIEALAKITSFCENEGLFKNASYIGTKLKWEQRLKENGYKVAGFEIKTLSA